VTQFNKTVGQNVIGVALDINAQAEEEFVDLKLLQEKLQLYDVIAQANYFAASHTISSNNVSVSYNPDLTTAKTVRITAAYGKVKFTTNIILSSDP
jgi:hypothetical protein